MKQIKINIIRQRIITCSFALFFCMILALGENSYAQKGVVYLPSETNTEASVESEVPSSVTAIEEVESGDGSTGTVTTNQINNPDGSSIAIITNTTENTTTIINKESRDDTGVKIATIGTDPGDNNIEMLSGLAESNDIPTQTRLVLKTLDSINIVSETTDTAIDNIIAGTANGEIINNYLDMISDSPPEQATTKAASKIADVIAEASNITITEDGKTKEVEVSQETFIAAINNVNSTKRKYAKALVKGLSTIKNQKNKGAAAKALLMAKSAVSIIPKLAEFETPDEAKGNVDFLFILDNSVDNNTHPKVIAQIVKAAQSLMKKTGVTSEDKVKLQKIIQRKNIG